MKIQMISFYGLLIRFELARKTNSKIGPVCGQDKHGSIANIET